MNYIGCSGNILVFITKFGKLKLLQNKRIHFDFSIDIGGRIAMGNHLKLHCFTYIATL